MYINKKSEILYFEISIFRNTLSRLMVLSQIIKICMSHAYVYIYIYIYIYIYEEWRINDVAFRMQFLNYYIVVRDCKNMRIVR